MTTLSDYIRMRKAAKAKKDQEAVDYFNGKIQELMGQKKPGYFESFARGAAQGATFGHSDEMAGAAAMAMSGGQDGSYDVARDEQRMLNDAASQENQLTYLGGEIAGSLLPIARIGQLAKLGQAIPNALTGAARTIGAGAAGGAVAGHGISDDTGMDLATDVAAGAAGGAVLAPVGGYVGNKVGDFLGDLGSSVKNKLWQSPNQMSDGMVRRALTDDGYNTAEDVIAARTRDDAAGNLRLFELGPNALETGVDAAKNPGPGRRYADREITKLQKGQSARVEQGIRDTVEPKWESYHKFLGDVSAQRKAQASQYYEKAYSRNFQPTQKLLRVQQVIEDGWPDVLAEAQKRSARKASLEPEGLFGEPGNFLGVADQVKRVLDDKISEAIRAGKNEAAADLLKVKNAWVGELDALIPDYKTARGLYAGARQMENAAEFGRGVLRDTKMFGEDLDEILKHYGPGEMDAFRIGLVRGAIDKMKSGTDMSDSSRKVFNSMRAEEVFDRAYPGGQTSLLKDLMEVEHGRSTAKNRVLGGSPTYQLQRQGKLVDDQRGQSVTGAATEFIRKMIGDGVNPSELQPGDYALIAKKLFGELSDDEIRRIMGRASATLGSSNKLGSAAERTATYQSGKLAEVDL